MEQLQTQITCFFAHSVNKYFNFFKQVVFSLLYGTQ